MQEPSFVDKELWSRRSSLSELHLLSEDREWGDKLRAVWLPDPFCPLHGDHAEGGDTDAQG